MKSLQSKVIVDIDWLVLHGDDLIVFVVCPESPLQEIEIWEQVMGGGREYLSRLPRLDGTICGRAKEIHRLRAKKVFFEYYLKIKAGGVRMNEKKGASYVCYLGGLSDY